MKPTTNPTDKKNEIIGAFIFFTCIVSFIAFVYLNTLPMYR